MEGFELESLKIGWGIIPPKLQVNFKNKAILDEVTS